MRQAGSKEGMPCRAHGVATARGGGKALVQFPDNAPRRQFGNVNMTACAHESKVRATDGLANDGGFHDEIMGVGVVWCEYS
jgi:hypothetical protein